MFGPRNIFGGFSIGKMLGTFNKTLGVVNQIIPIYKEAKPMINNARNAINLLKEFGSTTTTKIMNNTEKNLKTIKESVNYKKNISNVNIEKGPTFFQ